ncbi:hypothetical protein J4221_03475 [Candidatus Pacearchaeota archaeon]|nr:hypothetical protein [Candidatus Pacearchaeota archaeon]
MTHAYSYWLGPFGWGIFFVGLVIAIILFAVRRKFYPVMYLVSIATYIFTVGFIIDAFDFTKNLILVTLAITSIVFIVIGIYIAHKFERLKDSFSDSIQRKK